MALLDSEIVFRRATTNDGTGSNGGRHSATLVTLSNMLPSVSSQERTSGKINYRKIFGHIANADGAALVSPFFWQGRMTEGDDAVYWFPGTMTDTQSGIGTPRLYAAGYLASSVSGGATTLSVTFEDGTVSSIQNGDTIMIARMTVAQATATVGTWELATVSGVSGAGDTKSISLSTGLDYSFDATQTTDGEGRLTGYCIVSPVYSPPADIAASYSSFTVTSSAGTYDHNTYPISLNGISTIYQNWTLTFTSSTAFNIVGDTVGAVGSGNITNPASPNNPDYTAPYFTLAAGGWGGAFTTGDTVTFTTVPAMSPIWLKDAVPAGAGAKKNYFILYLWGDAE